MKPVIKIRSAAVRQKLQRLSRALDPALADFPVNKTAQQTLTTMKRETPKRFTGQTRRSWSASRIVPMVWIVENTSKVMRFLEFGTKAHGPKRAKALFIPLDRRTAMAGPDGVMNASPEDRQRYNFIFRKWVAGIKAHRIVRNHLPVARMNLKENIKQYLRESIQ